MLDSFVKYLSFEKRYSEHTVTSYKNDISQFKDFLLTSYEMCEWDKVMHIHIRSWLVSMSYKGLSNRSIHRKLSSLQTFYKFLIRKGIVQKNPLKKVVAPKLGKKLPNHFQPEVMERLFMPEMFEKSFSGLRDQVVLALFYHTGIRRSELMNLDLEDVDFQKNTLKVLGKGGKERLIPFGSGLQVLLEEYKGERSKQTSADAFIITDKGRRAYPKWIYNVVNKYLSLVTTAEKRSPHVLRHTFATHLTDQGAELNAVKELLGHANLAATQVYTHNSIERLKRIYKTAHPKG